MHRRRCRCSSGWCCTVGDMRLMEGEQAVAIAQQQVQPLPSVRVEPWRPQLQQVGQLARLADNYRRQAACLTAEVCSAAAASADERAEAERLGAEAGRLAWLLEQRWLQPVLVTPADGSIDPATHMTIIAQLRR